MKTKRVICIILSIMMALSVLASCQAEALVSTDPPLVGDSAQDTTPSQAQQSETQSTDPTVSPLSGFESYVDALGLSTDKLSQSTISGVKMTELLDKLVAYAAPDKLAEWQTKYPVLRASSEPLHRYDMMSALYLALWHIGGDYGYIMPTLDRNRPEMKATEGNVGPTWELFGEVPLFDIKD